MYAEPKRSGERMTQEVSEQDAAQRQEAEAALHRQAEELAPVEAAERTAVSLKKDAESSPDLPSEAPAVGAATTTSDARAAPAKPRSPKRLVLGAVLLAALAGGTWYGYHWWTVGRFTVSTDDAYVRASNTTLAAKVSGYVSKINIDDNTYVHAGDVIASIDDGDYRLAVDAAREKVGTQGAAVARIGQQIVAQGAGVEQAQAQVASAQAGAKRAQSELDRQNALAARDYASKQTLETALANRDQANAAVQSAQAALDAATAGVDVLKAQQQEAERGLDELKTALAKAERDLSFAVIRAPIDGVFGNRAMQVGDYVTPGQRLASLVPLDDIYIDANFKETQLVGLRAGQKVDVAVDALPDATIQGTVTSLAPASGSVFSLLPPDNATGNFTKIVQRVPVRIRVPADVAAERVLRPGMSVVVSVNTKGSAASRPSPVASRGVAHAAN
jgi:membrane fusion protein (multidrug efflux system)